MNSEPGLLNARHDGGLSSRRRRRRRWVTPTQRLAHAGAAKAGRCEKHVCVSWGLKFQEVCQTAKDHGDLPLDTDCRSYDPNERIESAEATLARKVGACTDTALATLDCCAASLPEAQTCITGAGREIADASFDAVYPPIPEPPTLTPTATATPPPTPPPDAVDCMVSDWSAYGSCSKAFGGGTQSRTRTVLMFAALGGLACPMLQESVSCNQQPCP